MVSHGVMSVLTKLAEEGSGKVMGGEWEVEDGGARATRRHDSLTRLVNTKIYPSPTEKP